VEVLFVPFARRDWLLPLLRIRAFHWLVCRDGKAYGATSASQPLKKPPVAAEEVEEAQRYETLAYLEKDGGTGWPLPPAPLGSRTAATTPSVGLPAGARSRSKA